MNYNPKRLQEQGNSSFSQGQDRHIWSVMISVAHKMACGPGPDFFKAVQWNCSASVDVRLATVLVAPTASEIKSK
jgi:hypothetical protein